MDFQGQRLAELFFYWIILSFGSVGWVIGYFQQDFTIVFQSWLVGVLLSVVVGRPVAASLVAFLVCWNDHAFINFFLLFIFHATALRPGLAFLQPTSRYLAWIGSGPKATHQIILNINLGNRRLRNCSVFLRRCRQSKIIGCMKAQSRGHSVDVQESNNFHFQIKFTFVIRSGSDAAGHACPIFCKDAFHSAHIALLVQNLGRKFYDFCGDESQAKDTLVTTYYRPAKSGCCHWMAEETSAKTKVKESTFVLSSVPQFVFEWSQRELLCCRSKQSPPLRTTDPTNWLC